MDTTSRWTLLVITISLFFALLVNSQSVTLTDSTVHGAHDTLLVCYVVGRSSQVRCVSARSPDPYSENSVVTTSVLSDPPTLPFISPYSPRPIQLRAQSEIVCFLRDDHSLVCFHPVTLTVTALAAACPYNATATYQCGVGRVSADGVGWIGSAFGWNGTADAARGFSSVTLLYDYDEQPALLLLTFPHRFPTYYGQSHYAKSLTGKPLGNDGAAWNVSTANVHYTTSLCLAPHAFKNATDKFVLESLQPVTLPLYGILNTSLDAVCGSYRVVCGLVHADRRVVCWSADKNLKWSLSPPPFFRFSTLECSQVDASGTVQACGILSTPSLSGKLFCWQTSNVTSRVMAMYWAIHELLQQADQHVLEQLNQQWRDDTSTAGESGCNAALDELPRDARPIQSLILFRSSQLGANIMQLNAAPVVSIDVDSAQWNDWYMCAVSTVPVAYCFDSLAITSSTIPSYRFGQLLSPLSPVVQASIVINGVHSRHRLYNVAHSKVANSYWAITIAPSDLRTSSVERPIIQVWSSDVGPASMRLADSLQPILSADTYEAVLVVVVNSVTYTVGVLPRNHNNESRLECFYICNKLLDKFISDKLIDATHNDVRRIIVGYLSPAMQMQGAVQDGLIFKQYNHDRNGTDWFVYTGASNTNLVTSQLLPSSITVDRYVVQYVEQPRWMTDSLTSAARLHVMAILHGDADIARVRNVSLIAASAMSNVWAFGDAMSNSTDVACSVSGIVRNCEMAPTLWTQYANDLIFNQRTRWRDVVASVSFMCALNVNGSIICFGDDYVFGWRISVRYLNATHRFWFGNGHDDANMNEPKYKVFSPPKYETAALSAPLKDLCVTPLYACAITALNTVLCWNGPYGAGRPMSAWDTTLHVSASTPPNSKGELIGTDIPIRASHILCADLMICALTLDGNIYCSAPPLTRNIPRSTSDVREYYDSAVIVAPQPIIGVDIIRLTSLGNLVYDFKYGRWTQTLCFVRRSGVGECRNAYETMTAAANPAQLAPVGFYRIHGGTELARCPGSTYSAFSGALSAACNGPCAAGFVGRNDNVNEFRNETCGGPCPVGHFCPLGNDGAIPCPAGTFGDVSGLGTSECSGACSLGHYCLRGTVVPTPCPAGTAGSRLGLTNSNCSHLCPPGEYADAVGTTQCRSCPAGMYSALAGSMTCDTCPSGHVVNAMSSGCIECPAGSYALAGSCIECAGGWYQNSSGATECSRCPGGTAPNAHSGATECVECPLGKFSNGTSDCQFCPISLYTLTPASVSCQPCGHLVGATCQNGIVFVDSQHHAVLLVQRTPLSDGTGTVYRNITLQLLITPCTFGYCTGTNSTAADLQSVDEYRQSDETAPARYAFLGQCSNSHDQSSGAALCDRCDPGFAPADITAGITGCVECDSVSALRLWMFFLLPFVFVVVYYIFANNRLSVFYQYLYFIQTVGIMIMNHPGVSQLILLLGFSPLAAVNDRCLAPMSVELQYLLPLFLPVMQIGQLAIIVAVQLIIKKYFAPTSEADRFRLDMLSMTYIQTAKYDPPVHALSLIRDPPRTNMMWWYCFVPQVTVSTILRTVWMILLSTFTLSIATAVGWFGCIDNGIYSVNFLFPPIQCRTPSYTAWTVLPTAVILFWCAVIVIIAGGACYYRKQLRAMQAVTVLNVRDAHALYPNRPERFMPHAESPSCELHSVHFLCDGSVDDPSPRLCIDCDEPRNVDSLVYRRVQHLLPLVLPTLPPQYASHSETPIVVWTVPLLRCLSWSWFAPHDYAADVTLPLPPHLVDESITASKLTDGQTESRRQYAFRAVFGALFDMFSPDATWWTVVILARRLALIVIAISLTPSPVSKFLLYFILHAIIYVAHSHYQPYALAMLNDTEQISIGGHMLIAVLLLAFPDISVSSTQLMLALAVAAVFIVALFCLLRHMIVRGKTKSNVAVYETVVNALMCRHRKAISIMDDRRDDPRLPPLDRPIADIIAEAKREIVVALVQRAAHIRLDDAQAETQYKSSPNDFAATAATPPPVQTPSPPPLPSCTAPSTTSRALSRMKHYFIRTTEQHSGAVSLLSEIDRHNAIEMQTSHGHDETKETH